MCGIIGAYEPKPSSSLKDRLLQGLNAIHHRGPDDSGYEIYSLGSGGVLALGHTRLSIIDLSQAGHQPMNSSDGRYHLVYNGEVYNYRELRKELEACGHRFQSDSDTEVVLTSWIHWGKDSLLKYKGMFAFVLFDQQENTLTCVRDAFGIKPFYYSYDDGSFSFSSEVPALLKLLPKQPELNVQCAYDYLITGQYDHNDGSFFEGVKQLPPAHMMTIDLSKELKRKKIERWWYPSIKEREDISFEEAASQLRAMFLDNIRLHLRSDVPLGIALSGGLDSSSVVCAVRHLEPSLPIQTFSYIARGSSGDEECWVDMVNAHVGAVPHKVVVQHQELLADLDDMIVAQGEPFGSTSIYAQYRVFQLAKENGMTVTLDGQGADELLAGYNGYPGETLLSLVEKGQFVCAYQFLKAWSRWPGRSFSHGLKALLGKLVPNSFRSLALKLVGRDPSPDWLNVPLLEDSGVVLGARVKPQQDDARGRRLVARLRDVLLGDGLSSLLRHGDRNSMRWSIESRVPFLTIEMAEFLLSLPEAYLISHQGETKHVFRAAMKGIVPDDVLNRKDKVGFETPEKTWLKGLGKNIYSWLSVTEELSFLNNKACHEEVTAILGGDKPFSFQVWRMINFCRWVQLMRKHDLKRG